MNKHFLIENESGGVDVMCMVTNSTVKIELKKQGRSESLKNRKVTPAQFPESKYFRAAWRYKTSGNVPIDLPAARAIKRQKLEKIKGRPATAGEQGYINSENELAALEAYAGE